MNVFVVTVAVWLLSAPSAAHHCENVGLMGDDIVMSVDTPFPLLVNGRRIEKVHIDVNGAIQLYEQPVLYSAPDAKSTKVPSETVGCCFGDLSSRTIPQLIRIAYADISFTPNGKKPILTATNSQGFGVFGSVSGPIGQRTWTLEWFGAYVVTQDLAHFTISFTENLDGYVILYDRVAAGGSCAFQTDTRLISGPAVSSGTKVVVSFTSPDNAFFQKSTQTFCSPCTTHCPEDHYYVSEPITCESLAIGQCREKRYSSECGFVDVPVRGTISRTNLRSWGEATLLMDLKFSDWKIGHVLAVEQMYNADCTETSVASPQTCTNGVYDVMITSFKDLPLFEQNVRVSRTFEGKGGEPVLALFPGDSSVNFNYGEEGSALRLGAGTDKVYGQIAVRALDFDALTTNLNVDVVLRFWTACAADVETVSTFSGYLTSPANPLPLTGNLDTLQTRTGRVPPPFVTSLLAREKVESIEVKAVGISGGAWLSEAQLWKIDASGKKFLWATYGMGDDGVFKNGFTSMSLETPMGKDEDMMLSSGDFLQWKCMYSSTVTPALPLTSGFTAPASIPSSSSFMSASCNIQLIFTNSRCGGAMYDGVNRKTPSPCDDPLFVDSSEPEPETQTHLVYDWRPSGDCSDGSQWMKHPYHCTNQYDGGKCAFCVGRANNMESRTCIERGGMGCNEMFNTPERVSFCNMEFECPATTVTFSLLAVFLALFGLLL